MAPKWRISAARRFLVERGSPAKYFGGPKGIPYFGYTKRPRIGTQRSIERTKPGAGASATGASDRSIGAAGIAVGVSSRGGISVTPAGVATSAGDGGVELSDSVGVADALDVSGERFLG